LRNQDSSSIETLGLVEHIRNPADHQDQCHSLRFGPALDRLSADSAERKHDAELRAVGELAEIIGLIRS